MLGNDHVRLAAWQRRAAVFLALLFLILLPQQYDARRCDIARRSPRVIPGAIEHRRWSHHVVETSSMPPHMRIAPDVSSHSFGAFPSGGFKPSCLAGLKSPAFFIVHINVRFGTTSAIWVFSRNLAPQTWGVIPQDRHGKSSPPTDKSNDCRRSSFQANQEAGATGSRELGCSKCQRACLN